MYIFIGVCVLDSAFEFKCVNLHINDYFMGVIIDIGSITTNKVKVAISLRKCLIIYAFYF